MEEIRKEELQRDSLQNEDLNDLEVLSMPELYDTAYMPRMPVIAGLLNCGLCIFSGAPKTGKSFLVLQMAYSVAIGQPLWDYPVNQGTVLYLALEDNYCRLQERLAKMFGEKAAKNLYLAVRSKKIQEGLVDQIERFVKDHPDTRLVIIDTLQKIREGQDDRYSYANDYDNITKLKQFSDKTVVCVLVVHHTRKLESSDSFAMISGTNGLLGAADAAFVLRKERRTGDTAILEITGRDQPDQQLTLKRDAGTCLWTKEDEEVEILPDKKDPVLERINAFIGKPDGEWHGSASELIEACPGLLELIKPNILTRKLNINCGLLFQKYSLKYIPHERTREKRSFDLIREAPKPEAVTLCDDCDDI